MSDNSQSGIKAPPRKRLRMTVKHPTNTELLVEIKNLQGIVMSQQLYMTELFRQVQLHMDWCHEIYLEMTAKTSLPETTKMTTEIDTQTDTDSQPPSMCAESPDTWTPIATPPMDSISHWNISDVELWDILGLNSMAMDSVNIPNHETLDGWTS